MDEIQELRIDQIRMDGGTQTRSGVRDDVVDEYSELMSDADNPREFPPIEVVLEPAAGTNIYWLADGFHRTLARKAAGFETVTARVTAGTRSNAILIGARANAFHGLRRSAEDKRAAVRAILTSQSFAGESDRWVAEKACVNKYTVGEVRKELGMYDQPRLGRDGKIRKSPTQRKKNAVTTQPTAAKQAGRVVKDDDGFDLNYGTQPDAPGDDLDDLSGESIYVDDDAESDDPGASTGSNSRVADGSLDEELGNSDDPVRDGLNEGREFDKLAHDISALNARAKKLSEGWGGAFLDDHKLKEFRAKLQNARQVIIDTRPHCECSYCRGNGCKTCRHSGYLPKVLATDAPQEQPAEENTAVPA